jgi:beta-galactosidase
VYPQQADFTFYGGLYRDVNLIKVNKTHFALDYYGGNGIALTPQVLEDGKGNLHLEAFSENTPDGTFVKLALFDQKGSFIKSKEGRVQNNKVIIDLPVENVHLWDGIEDPYLYTAKISLTNGKEDLDEIKVRTGFRTFEIDPEKGFILNGRPYQLIGTARHQDWEGLGNALSDKQHEIDMHILKEMGANTIRGAHYQHDQKWYDLADENGMIMWAEIPYISAHMANDKANENTQEQMRELIIQNYNHPSIVVWGLSNEITINGITDDLMENHKKLNDLCHQLDPTRKTVMAHVNFLSPDSELVALPDVSSFNLYYGWYLGKLQDNEVWFDEFHKNHPEIAIGLSEFGADANPKYHSEKPGRGDYTEDYQALYHEHILAMIKERPWIWATHVWNGFDFAADARNEGGVPGRNQKGLVTFDRKTKKDSYFIYKAYLSKEPFVHLTKKRYKDREEAVTEIKVYSNEPKVTLFVDGKNMGTQEGSYIFKWNIPVEGEHIIQAVGSDATICDEMVIRKVEAKNPEYIVEGGSVHNWFSDGIEKEGYLSIMDTLGEVMAVPEAAAILMPTLDKLQNLMGEAPKEEEVDMSAVMMSMPVETMLRMSKALGKDEIVTLNEKLNQVKK